MQIGEHALGVGIGVCMRTDTMRKNTVRGAHALPLSGVPSVRPSSVRHYLHGALLCREMAMKGENVPRFRTS
jgi:hypothetical protein